MLNRPRFPGCLVVPWQLQQLPNSPNLPWSSLRATSCPSNLGIVIINQPMVGGEPVEREWNEGRLSRSCLVGFRYCGLWNDKTLETLRQNSLKNEQFIVTLSSAHYCSLPFEQQLSTRHNQGSAFGCPGPVQLQSRWKKVLVEEVKWTYLIYIYILYTYICISAKLKANDEMAVHGPDEFLESRKRDNIKGPFPEMKLIRKTWGQQEQNLEVWF